MACVDRLWRNPATIFICDLAINDSPLCCWNDMDNSDSLQCPYNICYNVLLRKRSDVLCLICFFPFIFSLQRNWPLFIWYISNIFGMGAFNILINDSQVP